MNTFLDLAEEAVRQLPKSSKYIFGYVKEMQFLTGFSGLVMRGDREYFPIKCFVREKESCIVLRLSLPFQYKDEQYNQITVYLDCINKSRTVKSEFIPGEDQTVEVCCSVCYENHALTVKDLERTLAEMIVDAELFYPVIKAIGTGAPVPSDMGEPPWIYSFVIETFALHDLPCDTKAASRIYYEDYLKSQESAYTEYEHMINPGEESHDFCGTMKDKKRSDRFADPEFREKIFRMMFDAD